MDQSSVAGQNGRIPRYDTSGYGNVPLGQPQLQVLPHPLPNLAPRPQPAPIPVGFHSPAPDAYPVFTMPPQWGDRSQPAYPDSNSSLQENTLTSSVFPAVHLLNQLNQLRLGSQLQGSPNPQTNFAVSPEHFYSDDDESGEIADFELPDSSDSDSGEAIDGKLPHSAKRDSGQVSGAGATNAAIALAIAAVNNLEQAAEIRPARQASRNTPQVETYIFRQHQSQRLRLADVLRAAPGLKTLILEKSQLGTSDVAGCAKAFGNSALISLYLHKITPALEQNEKVPTLTELEQGIRTAPKLKKLTFRDYGKSSIDEQLLRAFAQNPTAHRVCFESKDGLSYPLELITALKKARIGQGWPTLQVTLSELPASKRAD